MSVFSLAHTTGGSGNEPRVGLAQRLLGVTVASTPLVSCAGVELDVGVLATGRLVIFVLDDAPDEWDGASLARCRGAREHALELAAYELRVVAVSARGVDELLELKVRERLPFELLSDSEFELARGLGLEVRSLPDGGRACEAVTCVVRRSVVEGVFAGLAARSEALEILHWLERHGFGE